MTHLEKAAQHFGLFLAEVRRATDGDLTLNDAACATLIADALEVLSPASDAAYVGRVVIRAALHEMHDAGQLATDNGEG